jgi:hypothetical protein
VNILFFVLGLLLGVGALAWGAIRMNRRRGGFGLMAGGVIAMVAGLVAGVTIPDGNAQGAAERTAPSAAWAITAPKNLEELDAQDFLLEGTGLAGESFELLSNGSPLANITVGADNTWSYNVSNPAAGDYEFSLRGTNIPTLPALKVNVAPGRAEASNARCPCRLRVETRAPNATITLTRAGEIVARQPGPVYLFRDLEAGTYGIKVEAEGFQTFESAADKFSTPRNKTISVYLNKQ